MAGAEIYLAHGNQPTGLLIPTSKPVTTTDSGGVFRFQIAPDDELREPDLGYCDLLAVKPGFGFAWSVVGKHETSGKWLAHVRAKAKKNIDPRFRQSWEYLQSGIGEPLKLVVDDQPLRGRIVDINGQPVKGARLTLTEVWGAFGDDLGQRREATKEPNADFYSTRLKMRGDMNSPQVRSLITPAVTDGDGRFTLHGIGRGRIAELLVEGSGISTEKILARTEAGEKIVLEHEHRAPHLGSDVYYPAELLYVAGPSVPIVGVVRDATSKAPLAGVTVKSQKREGHRINGWGEDFVRAVTDDQGAYRLEGMPIGDDNRIAVIRAEGQNRLLVSEPRRTHHPGQTPGRGLQSSFGRLDRGTHHR